jgi:2,3-bisphosphoglycerate-independent phosphoglycerate mutase
MDACRETGSALHLMGLLSDGGVHSHNTHLWAFLELAARRGLQKVFIHAFLGRPGRVAHLRPGLREGVRGKMRNHRRREARHRHGRYYGMDRDKRWDRVKRAYDAMVFGEAPFAPDPEEAVAKSYASGVTDEFVEPVVCDRDGMIKAGDSVIFFNFRPDRAREITRALVDPAFDGFARKNGVFPLQFVCTTEYDALMPNVSVAFPRLRMENIFGAYLSQLGLTQLRIAETEKNAHVTFFFNGGEEKVFPGEDRVLIPSPKVATYDLKPEMSAFEVAEETVARLRSGQYDVVIVNFANCDMVGHTGVFEAAVKAVETVDACVGQVVDAHGGHGRESRCSPPTTATPSRCSSRTASRP